ncbi:hypothetical protein MKZ38_006845 [Zalerion maritima]|uniref:Uncharacterized protein n=1 Tax=Zalerion maritima TaxID=339359 RepID=A0AAD5RJI8_9PEZI|nr:hypothetical protein MKZ38_006845 [Zalerion maritima]
MNGAAIDIMPFQTTAFPCPSPIVGMHKPTAAPTHHPAYTQHNRPNNRVWDEEPVVVSGQGHPTTGSEETAPAAASSGQENNPFATPPPSKSSEGRIADVPISPASAPAPANPEHETDNELPRASRVRDWVREIPGRLETMRDPATHHPFIPPKGLRSNHIIEVNRVAQTSGRSKSVATPERVPDGAPSAPVGTQTPAITINTPSSTTPNFDGQTPNTTNEPRISSRHTRSNLQPHASAQQYQYPLNTPQKYPPRSAPQTPIYVSGGPPAIPTSKISETGRHHLQQGPNYPFTNFQQAGLSRLGNNACTCGHCHQTGSLQMLGSDGYLSSGDSGTELGEVRDRGG